MTWATAYAALSVICPRVQESRKIILIFNFFFIIFPFLALIPIIIFAVSAQKYAKLGYQLFDVSSLFTG